MRNNVAEINDEILLLDNQLCFTLYAASRKVIQLYRPMLKKLDLTYTQYITMLVLWERGPLPVKDLGRHLMLDTGTLTPLLKKMEGKGLIHRTRSNIDERVVMIELTQIGSSMKKRALQQLPAILCSSSLNSADLINIRDRLKGLINQLDSCMD
jgi:MarR family transcriptional regulator, organic hydroperoxide resistance regulator